MSDPLAAISTRRTPQNQRATGPEGARQKPNAAGGFAFKVTDEVRVRRFLTLGTDGGTYYATAPAITKDNATVILGAARDRTTWLVDEIVAISTAGRAPRHNAGLFALAAAAALGDDAGRRYALDALPAVARTGTHLFLFAGYVEQFRGWGRGLRNGISRWYLSQDPNRLAYQVVKYRQREGWTHRDLLRLAHPKTTDPRLNDVLRYAAKGTIGDIALINMFVDVQGTRDVERWLRHIDAGLGLSWEMFPDEALAEPRVWRALVAQGMPMTALIRQLPRLTRLGVLDGDTLRSVCDQLESPERLRRARVHPINVLVAQRTYASGQSARGSSEWTPKRQIVDALDAAFYAAFAGVEPAGKRTLLVLDVSGSMGWPIGGQPITAREASAALALVTMVSEPDTTVVGFTSGSRSDVFGRRNTGITELPISPRQRLDDAIRSISGLPFGATDCSLPFSWATGQGREFDTVVVFTDNETWSGEVHPHQALKLYRERMGLATRLIVVGMTATDVSIADPNDPGMLDVAGFDAAVPTLIADFSRGDL